MSQAKTGVALLSRRLGLNGRLGVSLFALLLLTKFSPIEATLTTLAVVGHTLVGLQIISRSSGANNFSRTAQIGLGFCLGATLTTLVYIVSASIFDTRIAVITQLILFGVALGARYRRPATESIQATAEEISSVKWIAVLALIGLSPDWFWCLAVAACLGAFNLAIERYFKKQSFFGAAFLAVVAFVGVTTWVRIVDRRPSRAWFADDRFAEVLSFSLGKWGLSHNPMLLGEGISYHWFSFAWVGALSRLANSPIDVTLFHFAPVVVAFCCAILGYSIARRFSGSAKVAFFAIAVAFFVDTERLFRGYGFHAFQLSSFSQFFSLAIGLAILLAVVTLGDQIFEKMPFICAALLFALVGSKISSGLIVSIALIAVWVFKKKGVHNLISRLRTVIVAVAIPVVASFLFFFGDPRNGSASVIRRPGWPAGISRDLWDVYNGSFIRYLPILLFLSLALGGFALLPLISRRGLIDDEIPSQIVTFFLGGLIASLAQMWIAQGSGASELVGDSDNTLYSLQLLVSLSFVLVFSVAMPSIVRALKTPLSRVLVIASLLSGVSVAYLSTNLKIEVASSYLVPFLTSLKPSLPFLFSGLFALCLLASINRFRLSLGGFKPRTVAFIVLVTIQGATGLFLAGDNYAAVSGRQQAEWRTYDSTLVPSQATTRAAKWLKARSGASEIIATTMTSNSPSLATLTSRRELAGFPITIRLMGLNSEFDARDRDAISQFGSTGSCEGAEYLRSRGVGYFWVETLNPNTPDIDRCAAEVFRDETIVIYSLIS